MTRSLKNTLATVGLSALLGGVSILGAQPLQLSADIPFAFHAEGRVLPPGTYQLNSEGAPGIFQISNRAAGQSEFVNAPVPATYMPKKSELKFERHGNEYVLSEISIAGTNQSSAVSPTAIEKNLTRKLGLAGMISVPLHAR